MAIPTALTAAPGVPIMDESGHVIATGLINLPAIAIVALVTLVLVRGVSESAAVNNIIVMIKVSIVLAFIIIGSRYVHPANWTPLVPAQIPAQAPGTAMGFLAPGGPGLNGRHHRG